MRIIKNAKNAKKKEEKIFYFNNFTKQPKKENINNNQ